MSSETQKESEESVSLAHKTESSFKAIMESVDRISDMGAQIAQASQNLSELAQNLAGQVLHFNT